MPTTAASGTQTATIATEHSLATDATAGTYVLIVNLTNLANADTVVLRVKTKVLTGDTAETIYEGSYSHDQGSVPIVASPPVVSMHSITVTLEQTDGTGRAFPWALLRL